MDQEIDFANSMAQADQLVSKYDESSRLSWLWAFLFGPIYFAVHGFWGRAVLTLVLNALIVGFFVSPFLAYPAWRKRAEEKAFRAIQTASMLQRVR